MLMNVMQIGTVNYMSPEAIEVPEGQRRLKVGRPSDVWSLGCILYQMVYSHPPFQQLSVFQKMKAIPDDNYIIHFPEMSVPSIPAPRNASGAASAPPQRLTHLGRRVRRDVIRTMKTCLVRNPKDRAAIPELLNDDWLCMKEREYSCGITFYRVSLWFFNNSSAATNAKTAATEA